MTIALIKAGIQSVTNGLTFTVGSDTFTLNALTQEPDENPATAQLPMMYPIATRGSYDYDKYGDDDYEVSRDYQLYVLVSPKGQETAEIRETRCEAAIDAITNQLTKYISLGNVAGIQEARIIGDSGPIPNLRENYMGAIITLRVPDMKSRSFGSNE